MTERTKSILVNLAKVAVGLAVLAYVIAARRLDFGELSRGDPAWVAAGFAVLLAIPILGWLRWWTVVRGQGIALGAYPALRIHLIGVFFNAFLLGSMGGDVVKAYYVATGPGSDRKPAAVMTMFLDRAYGALGLLTVVAAGVILAWGEVVSNDRLRLVVVLTGIVCAGWFALLALLLMPRMRAKRRRLFARFSSRRTFGGRLARVLDEMDEAVQVIVRHPRMTASCFALSVAGHVATSTAFSFFGRSLGVEGIPLRNYMILSPIALLGAGLPLPGGALGAGELFASVVFGVGSAVEAWVGGTILFVWRLGLFVPGPVGFVYFLFHREEVRRAREAASADESPPAAAAASPSRSEDEEGPARAGDPVPEGET
jgi:hypothetical protein